MTPAMVEAPVHIGASQKKVEAEAETLKCEDVGRLVLRLNSVSSTAAPTGAAEERSTVRRRLQEDTDLPVRAWQHLQNLDIDLAELNCSAGVSPSQALRQPLGFR